MSKGAAAPGVVDAPAGVIDGGVRGWRLPRKATFTAAALALVAVYASSGTPIPLYNTYRVEDGITNPQLALTTVIYLSVTAASLLVFGRLSNHLGRRPVALAAVAASALGCFIFMNVHDLTHLLLGRALQGVACGMASSSLGAYVIDTAPAKPRWLAALVTGSAPTFGVPIGAILSGTLVEVAPAPRVLGFSIIVGVLAICGLSILFSRDTIQRSLGAGRALIPRLDVPVRLRHLLVPVIAAFVATWCIGGFYQAFAPSLTADYLGTDSSLVIALVFSSIVVLNPVGGSITGPLSATKTVVIGLIAFMTSLGGVLVGLHLGSIVMFLVASLAASVAMGAATTGAMRILLDDTQPLERAGVLSTIYLVSYSGAAAPGLVTSAFGSGLSLTDVAAGYVALAAVSSLIAVVAVGVLRRRS